MSLIDGAEPPVAVNQLVGAIKSAFDSIGPKVDIPKYNGRENPMYFILSFQLATERLPESQKMNLFRAALTGAAHIWFCGRKLKDDMDGEEVTCAQWEQRLQANFAKTEDAAQDELEARHQTESESIADYVRDVLRLCNEVDPTMSEKKRLRHLQKGLLEKYQHDMLVMDPKDTASFQEKLFKLSTHRPSSAREAPTSDRALLSSLIASLAAQRPAQESPALAAASAAAPTTDAALAEILKALRGLKGQSRGPRRRQFDGRCFRCNKPGHVVRDCKQPPNGGGPAENSAARSE